VVATSWQPEKVKDEMSPEVWRARLLCGTEFVKKMMQAGAVVIVVADRTSKQILEGSGAHVLETDETRTGQARRIAFSKALECVDEKSPHAVVWSESEKFGLAEFLPRLARPVVEDVCDVLIPRRQSLASYPSWQQPWEETANRMCAKILGSDLDYFFGPRVMNARALQKFIDYPGSFAAVDGVDSVYAPLVDCVHARMRFGEVMIDFEYPKGQSQAEEVDLTILPRRTKALHIIVSALYERTLWLSGQGERAEFMRSVVGEKIL
jgi:hypothetical protein